MRDAREEFIDIQAAIEAVDRAIEDEYRQVATKLWRFLFKNVADHCPRPFYANWPGVEEIG